MLTHLTHTKKHSSLSLSLSPISCNIVSARYNMFTCIMHQFQMLFHWIRSSWFWKIETMKRNQQTEKNKTLHKTQLPTIVNLKHLSL